jgi:hypothetical protein
MTISISRLSKWKDLVGDTLIATATRKCTGKWDYVHKDPIILHETV